jgi:hypothetical protein
MLPFVDGRTTTGLAEMKGLIVTEFPEVGFLVISEKLLFNSS